MTHTRGSRWTRRLATFASCVLLASTFHVPPASAKPAEHLKPQAESVVDGYTVKSKLIERVKTGQPFSPPAPVWPTATNAEVALPSPRIQGSASVPMVAAAGLPVRLGKGSTNGPEKIQVQSYDRAVSKSLGVDGLLVRLSRADGVASAGSAEFGLDYSAFRYAYGGDWATRLQLRVLPDCFLTSPAAAQCQGYEVKSRNDVRSGVISGEVSVAASGTQTSNRFATSLGGSGGTLVALTAGASGAAGDYSATSLAPSATWTGGSNSGDFSWSYPLRTPPGLGGPTPKISVNYSSASVDGRMAASNSQPSWFGEGFDWQPGSIERRYNSCAEDMGAGANNSTKTGDQCWDTDNAMISLSGHAGELIKDNAVENKWHLRNDDGTVIERKYSASNGDNDGEWWVATTTDGTQYWFGGRAGANSTLNTEVFGNHVNEPCHLSTFAASHCTQTYRWYLDYVVDLHGNTMSYTYTKDTNKYGMNNSTTNLVSYDRAGYLEKIEYGTHTAVTGSAPMRVLFNLADRCLANCAAPRTATNFPDVPTDKDCAASPCNNFSPTFWMTKRISSIQTEVWDGVSAYRPVERWGFTHTFPDPLDGGVGITPALWLEKISHVGLVGGEKNLPDVTFVGELRPNRVDTNGDQFPAMNKFRVTTVNSESGGKLGVTYYPADCDKNSGRIPNKDALQDNNLRCYPVKWAPPGYTDPINDYFHKYVVKDVTESDLTGSSGRAITHYDYVGTPSWHYSDEDGMTKKEMKTWAGWRGYGAVVTTKGDGTDVQTKVETRYFRGMHGDHLPSGTRNIVMPAIAIGNVPAVNDEDPYNGLVRETITYNGPAGAEVSATAGEPWMSAPTATRTLDGTTVYARIINLAVSHSRTAMDGGRAPRLTKTVTTFDAYAMPTKVEDFGDTAKADDEKCTLTDYIRNTAINLVDRVARSRTYAVDCTKVGLGGLTDDDAVSDDLTSYDGLAWNVAPTVGNVTKTETMKTFNGGSPTYFTASITNYDLHGRVHESWDTRGAKTTTTYTPASGGPEISRTETSHLGWVKSTVNEPAWGVPTSTTDVNGRKVTFAYDGLGRLTSVWYPGREAPQPANVVYDYLIRNAAPTVVTTKRLNPAGGYITSYKLYDNLLRMRQTQDPDHAGNPNKTVVTETFYDSAGRTFKTHDQYVAGVAPSTELYVATGNIPSLKVTQYDGAGRDVAQIQQKDGAPGSPGGTEMWKTTTVYGGDRTDVTPPQGGTSTSSLTDARGNVVELRQYRPGYPVGGTTGYDKTTYDFNRKNQLTKVTDAANIKWEYQYDLAGRQTVSIDPDKGTTTTTFNDSSDVLTTKNGKNEVLAYTYDAVGRKTTLRSGSDTGPKRAEWVYDRLSNGTFVYGQVTKTIRWDGTDQYIKEHVGYTQDYKPTSVKYTIPNSAFATGLNGAYSYVYTYYQDGSPETLRMPALGDLSLGQETLTYGYNSLGKPLTLNTSLVGGTYLDKPDPNTPETEYTSFGEIAALHLRNNAGDWVDVGNTYETETRRLAQIITKRQQGSVADIDVRFSYDGMGNVTKIVDQAVGDRQCFRTDHLRRLTEAWTPDTDNCVLDPTAGALGGPAKYWHSYEYDTTGTRSKLIEHTTATGEKTTTYTVPGGAHKLTATSTVDDTGTKAGTYQYDASGNTEKRPTATAGTQTLSWDVEGHLATSIDTTGTTSYLYDVDGSRLIRKDPTGKTLYLPGQELRYQSGVKKCTRYYTHAERTIATRTSSGLVWLAADHHGTANLSVNAVGQATSIRRQTPFGELRSTTGTWPSAMDKGFVGGTKDNTGLTHLGAREYDPLIGRFISVDPVIDSKDPQQMHGYSYANNSPVTASDPDGLWPKWADKALSAVNNVVQQQVSSVASAVKAAGTWVYDNAGTISTVLGVAAMVCAVVPPLQAVAPFLGAASTAIGAIETFKTCKEGMSLDCAMGITDLIPGGRALGALGKAAKYADEAADLAKANKLAPGRPRRPDVDAGDGPPAKPKGGGCRSFDPKTPVLMANGAQKAIGDIIEGEQVLAMDPKTGINGSYDVTARFLNLDVKLTDLMVRVDPDLFQTGDEYTDTISTTQHHLILDLTVGAWTYAGSLEPGHLLHNPGAATVKVVAVHNYLGEKWMSDLTVNGAHSFYVMVGDAAVLVHNMPVDDAGNVHPNWAVDEIRRIKAGNGTPRTHAPPSTVQKIYQGHESPAHAARWGQSTEWEVPAMRQRVNADEFRILHNPKYDSYGYTSNKYVKITTLPPELCDTP
ncbi:hypothetical protein Rhe02_19950 [Rhizocola hellebori]|uniref:Hint domain-containing protein n=1 Tax=Rhizocola hellebori TaxID=1392758 RepID=A0A8J3VFI8_9ACTN|nr:RHS repeat-associated core domain-containing protein [Rhizocola hellebori]GIH03928.1 hypothetical protein Rhe02_19950 [Rhizocola hellebori]